MTLRSGGQNELANVAVTSVSVPRERLSCFLSSCWPAKISKWVSFTCGLWAFWSDVFALASRLSGSVYCTFKSGFCYLYSPIVFLSILSVAFQSQMFQELISLAQDLRVGVPDVELKFLTSQGSPHLWDPSRPQTTMPGVWGFFFPLSEKREISSTHLGAVPWWRLCSPSF